MADTFYDEVAEVRKQLPLVDEYYSAYNAPQALEQTAGAFEFPVWLNAPLAQQQPTWFSEQFTDAEGMIGAQQWEYLYGPQTEALSGLQRVGSIYVTPEGQQAYSRSRDELGYMTETLVESGQYWPTSGPMAEHYDPIMQHVMSRYVVDPMGYQTTALGGTAYEWGDLAAIYNATPIETVAQRVNQLQQAGELEKARITQLLYSSTRQEWREGEGAEAFQSQVRRQATGQVDVGMDPRMVSRMLTQRERARSQRRYKGGTVVNQNLLGTTAEQYKRYLGG